MPWFLTRIISSNGVPPLSWPPKKLSWKAWPHEDRHRALEVDDGHGLAGLLPLIPKTFF